MGQYYLYRHVIPNGNPFYIGIGTKRKYFERSETSEYNRAYKFFQRNIFWKRVYEKYGVEVEIIFESDSYEEILQKEIEFIKLYGRRDLGTGLLVNLTDGGDGNKNYIVSEESKEKNRLAHKGRTWPLERKQRVSEKLKKFYSENQHFYSEETRKKMSIAQSRKVGNRKGSTQSQETKNKLRQANLGKKHSPESIAKMSGKKLSKESIAKRENTKKINRLKGQLNLLSNG